MGAGASRSPGTKKMDIARVAPPQMDEREMPKVCATRMGSGEDIVKDVMSKALRLCMCKNWYGEVSVLLLVCFIDRLSGLLFSEKGGSEVQLKCICELCLILEGLKLSQSSTYIPPHTF